MKMIKTLILATIVASALNPAASICARESAAAEATEPRDAAARAVLMTPGEVAEEVRIQQFVAKKTEHVFPFLPVNDVVNIVLDYTKPIEEEVAQTNKNLQDGVLYDDELKVVTSLNEGADSNIFLPGMNRQTPLHWFSRYGYVKMVRLLLNHKAYIDTLNLSNETPLMIAIRHGRTKIVKILMAAGAKPDIKNKFSKTTAWTEAKDNPKMLQAMQEGLAEGLSKMLLESNILRQYVGKPGIVFLINDYAALGNE